MLVVPEHLTGADLFFWFLDQARETFIAKNADYAGAKEVQKDVWLNFRAAEEIGVPAFISCWVRLIDKERRAKNVFRAGAAAVKDESLLDTFVDAGNYNFILASLYVEFRRRYGERGLRLLHGIMAQMIELLDDSDEESFRRVEQAADHILNQLRARPEMSRVPGEAGVTS